jgi:hypothetical protein
MDAIQNIIYFGRHFAWMRYFIYHRHCLRSISSTFCRWLKLEKYVIHLLNFMSDLIILIHSGGGGREVHVTFKGDSGYNIFGTSTLDQRLQ